MEAHRRPAVRDFCGTLSTMDSPSKRLLAAWIVSDVIWAVLFIRAVKRADRRTATG
jgi:hypothetical protein